MITLKPRRLLTYLVGDALTIISCSLTLLYFFREVKFSVSEWIALSAFVLLWFLIEYWLKLSGRALNQKFRARVVDHFKAYSIFIAVIFFFYLFCPVQIRHRSYIIALVIAVAIFDIFINYLLFVFGKLKIHPPKHVVIAGTGNSARNAEDRLTTERGNDYLFQGFINCDQEEECVIEGNRVLGHINDINQYFESNSIDEIVIAMPGHFTKEIQKVVKVADYHGIRTIYLPDYSELFGSQYSISKYGEVDAVNVRSVPMDRRFPRYCKSAFDKVFAAVVLILLSPLFLLLSILIKMESPGPVFYCPIRIGRGGKPFKVFKFRSMRENDDSSKGTLSTSENDPRITSLGATLRKYSLDELPQFFNVLMGDMSVVGPRPHRRFLDRQLQASVSNYMIRHYVKPGITGWAQVNGWRGPSTTDIQKKQRTEHDLYYVENWSLLFDIKIILLTFGKKAHSAAY